MTGLLIILVSFAFGVAGGFLAMHFYFQHHFFVTKEEFDAGLIEELDNLTSDANYRIDALQTTINDFSEHDKNIEKKMDDHYRWSLGIWNDIANHRESIENPIPESIQEVAREEVQLNEDDEVMPMGPIEEAKQEFEVVDPSLGEAVDQEKFIQDVVQMLKDDAMESLELDVVQMFKDDAMKSLENDVPDRVKPLRQTKKKKGKK